MIFSHRTFYTLAHLFLSWVGPTRLLEDYRLQVFAVSDQRETLNRRRVEFLGMQKGDGLLLQRALIVSFLTSGARAGNSARTNPHH